MGSALAKITRPATIPLPVLDRGPRQPLLRHHARASMDGDAGICRRALALFRGRPMRVSIRMPPHRVADTLRANGTRGRRRSREPSPAVSTSRPRRSRLVRTIAWCDREIAPSRSPMVPRARSTTMSVKRRGEHTFPRRRRAHAIRTLDSPPAPSVTEPGRVRVAGQLDVARHRNLARERASCLNADQPVVGSMYHEGRYLERTRDRPDVDLGQPSQVR